MIQKIKILRLHKIVRILLQSIFYLGCIALMVYIGYSKNKDKNWSLLKEIQHNQKEHKIESSALGTDSTNLTVWWIGFEDIQSNQVLYK